MLHSGEAMRAISTYSLIRSAERAERAQLARDGQMLDAEIEGLVLESQFELDDASALLWLTDDCPYEEGLHIYLLAPDGAVRDAIEAGAGFGLGAPGILKILRTGGDWVEFEFFLGGQRYRLQVDPDPRIHLRLPNGWRYKKWFTSHRLRVEEFPGI